MKKKTSFEKVKQYFFSDKGDLNWWVDEEDLEDHKEVWEDNPEMLEVKKERTISGHEYNKWLIGNVYGDYEGNFTDEECSCGHLLIFPDDGDCKGKERFCSSHDCEFVNKEMKEYQDAEEVKWKRISDAPELPRFREEGQTIEEFMKKYGFTTFKPEDKTCVVCKKQVEVSDFYRTAEYAAVLFEHEGCTNKGPAIFIPQGKKAEDWAKIL